MKSLALNVIGWGCWLKAAWPFVLDFRWAALACCFWFLANRASADEGKL